MYCVFFQLFAEVLGFEFESFVFPNEAFWHLDSRRELAVVALYWPKLALGDDVDLTVVFDEHVDVVSKHCRKRDISLFGDLSERLKGVFVHPKRDRLVFVSHRYSPLCTDRRTLVT